MYNQRSVGNDKGAGNWNCRKSEMAQKSEIGNQPKFFEFFGNWNSDRLLVQISNINSLFFRFDLSFDSLGYLLICFNNFATALNGFLKFYLNFFKI